MPFTLNFTLHREIEDQTQGLLRAHASGDITGTVEWRLEQNEPAVTTAHFSQHVILEHPIARRTDFALRPILIWNHAHAMRSGRRGLLAHLTRVTRTAPPLPLG